MSTFFSSIGLLFFNSLLLAVCSSGEIQEKANPLKIEFVSIDGGHFLMGDSLGDGRKNERPQKQRNVSSFRLSKFEITNSQYSEFLNVFGNRIEGGKPWLDIESPHCNIELKAKKHLPKKGKENHPVIEVSWYGARAFAKWVDSRLPTEAEWEYAASYKGKHKRYPTGFEMSGDLANIKGREGKDVWDGTSPVGSFPPNELGLYDMAGNVWEWCQDVYTLPGSEKRLDPVDPIRGLTRVVKGGSWSFPKKYATRSYRAREYAASWSYDNGFRIAKDNNK